MPLEQQQIVDRCRPDPIAALIAALLNDRLESADPILGELNRADGGGEDLDWVWSPNGSPSPDDWDEKNPPPPDGMEEWHYSDNND